jgi:hypothetical protein
VRNALVATSSELVASLGARYLDTLARYERDAAREGATFVEIQNTMLFATVGQRVDAAASVSGQKLAS